ncbi:serine/threonine-protein kinase Nek7-like [Topomyia yanbarensis]|uniref:serine/threonine-protein kinase Nek7-like n=1 Tax=Topomyia yanbarensis TaxID=2498891 RepID=UPI00273B1A88|nr:serine/threonine-protein kinase Nek7-like [Topomyia yanbarensis]
MLVNIDLSSVEFESHLGSGCYGGNVSLYRNRKDKRNRRLVIKSIPYNSPEYAYKTVLKEHTILSQINHPRILRYFGFFQTSDSWNMITEFAERGNLADFLQRRRVHRAFLSQRLVMVKFMDMVEALQYLHQRKVIHRDLKPENVLIDADNRLKLADFGIAKICSTHPNGSELDELNMTIVGTPLYMAPEVATGKRYDYKSDVWPLGIIFYEMCMLDHPFLGSDLTENGKIKFKAPRIDCDGKGYQPGMQLLCEMMVQVEPKKRWTLENIIKDAGVISLMT